MTVFSSNIGGIHWEKFDQPETIRGKRRLFVPASAPVALRPLLATWQRGLLIGRVKLKTLEDVDWTNVISFTDYLVGGLEHFFHNIWDNPSH